MVPDGPSVIAVLSRTIGVEGNIGGVAGAGSVVEGAAGAKHPGGTVNNAARSSEKIINVFIMKFHPINFFFTFHCYYTTLALGQ